MICRIALILIAGLLAGAVSAEDVLSRSQRVGDALYADLQTGLHRLALQQADPFRFARSIGTSLELAEHERVHVLADDGTVFASGHGGVALPPEARTQVLAEPIGVGTYHAFLSDYSDVVRRDFGWSRQWLGGREWIVVVERDRRLERDLDEPLTGRWMGAYSYTGIRAGAEPVEKEAGPLSVLILQDGDRCQLRAVSQRWNALCSGMVSGTNLTAAADSTSESPTLILEANFEPGTDKIRGILHLAGSAEAGKATVFLQRAPE